MAAPFFAAKLFDVLVIDSHGGVCRLLAAGVTYREANAAVSRAPSVVNGYSIVTRPAKVLA